MNIKRFAGGFVKIAVVGLISFVGGLFLFDTVMKAVVGQGDETHVPEVVGLPEGEADVILGDRGLYLAVDNAIFDAETDSGTVLVQRPAAGDKVKRGRTIQITVSKGPESLSVPEVSAMRVRQARIALSRAGLRADSIIRVPHDQVGQDIVIATWPTAGTPLIVGEPVQLLVSLGPAEPAYLMPDLQGKRESEVRRHLNLFGLGLARVTYTQSEGSSAGSVIRQSPPPGARVDARTSVEVEVSSP